MLMTIIIAIIVALLFVTERFRPSWIRNLEETIIAILLATITLISFIQVIARYGFSSGWGGALEFTSIMFAWMILFGMSYGVRIGSHLGVDALIRKFPKPLFKACALLGALCGLIYGITLLNAEWLHIFGADTKGGAIEYWSKFYKAGIGLEDLRYPDLIRDIFGTKERVQRWIAYLMLPIGLGLLSYRCAQAFVQILTGQRELIVAGHEAEDLVAENKDALKD